MRLYELQQTDIEKQLQDVASGIGDAQNSPDPMGAGTPPGPDPNAAAPAPEPEDPTEDFKPVPPELMAAVKGQPYLTEYKPDEASKIHPMRLLSMGVDDLNKIRNLVRTKVSMLTVTDEFGLYDSPDMKFYQDLMAFVERIIDFKKNESKTAPAQSPQVELDKQKKQQAPQR